MGKIFSKLGKAFTNPSPRGKVRWAFLGIVILAIVATAVDYPKGFNKVVDRVNQGLFAIGLSEFGTLQETEFNLGLDLQGGTRVLLQPEKILNPIDLGTLMDNMQERLNVYGLTDLKLRDASDLTGKQ